METSGDYSKKQGSTAKRLPPNAGKGRKKGVPNRITFTLKQAIEAAFHEVGGKEWLVQLAGSDPRAFASLLGRILPAEINGQVRTVDEHLIVRIDISDGPGPPALTCPPPPALSPRGHSPRHIFPPRASSSEGDFLLASLVTALSSVNMQDGRPSPFPFVSDEVRTLIKGP